MSSKLTEQNTGSTATPRGGGLKRIYSGPDLMWDILIKQTSDGEKRWNKTICQIFRGNPTINSSKKLHVMVFMLDIFSFFCALLFSCSKEKIEA